MDDSIGGS